MRGKTRVNGRVAMKEIRKAAEKIAAEVKVDKVILFGSYAYGQPRRGSDVDLLVITSTRQRHSELRYKLYTLLQDFPVGLDIVFRKPAQVSAARSRRDWFLQDVMTKGRVVYG